MNQDNLPRLYSLTQMGIATFLGSAIAAGYMLAQNYAALGQPKLGRYVLAGSVVLVLGMGLLPVDALANPGTAVLVLIGQILLVLVVANQLQGKMLASFIDMGGRYHTMMRAVLIGVIASLIFTVIFAFVVLLFGTALPQTPATSA